MAQNAEQQAGQEMRFAMFQAKNTAESPIDQRANCDPESMNEHMTKLEDLMHNCINNQVVMTDN